MTPLYVNVIGKLHIKKKRELALVKLFQKQQIVDCFKPIKFELIFKGALNQSGLNDSIEWFYQKGLEKKKKKIIDFMILTSI